MQLLFGVGTCAGLTDGQLLERFLAGRDQAGEMAAVLRRLNDLERKVEALQKERVGN